MLSWKVGLALVVAFLAALGLTGMLRRYALARSLLDVPNARSSHSVSTPRGGGLAIVVVFLGALVCLYLSGSLPPAPALAMLGAGGLIAAIGFFDDHGHIPARWRLLVHFSAAAWVLYCLGGAPTLQVFGTAVELGNWGSVLMVFGLVWLTNLYNFMDGIDGIASVEAICAGLGGAVLCWLAGLPWLVAPALLLVAAVAGFLWWNFPPARIFMGDAGSGFLGAMLGAMALIAGHAAPQLLWAWLILLGVFIVDATWTLLRRLLRGEKVYEAHRSHAYQVASRRYGRHLPVTLAVGAINLLWLFPLATLVAMGRLDGIPGLGLAYAPLIVLAVYSDAGGGAAI